MGLQIKWKLFFSDFISILRQDRAVTGLKHFMLSMFSSCPRNFVLVGSLEDFSLWTKGLSFRMVKEHMRQAPPVLIVSEAFEVLQSF